MGRAEEDHRREWKVSGELAPYGVHAEARPQGATGPRGGHASRDTTYAGGDGRGGVIQNGSAGGERFRKSRLQRIT